MPVSMGNADGASGASPGVSLTAGPVRAIVPPGWTGVDSVRPYPPTRLDQIVERQAARTPEAIALRDESSVLTYAEAVERAHRLARALRARGIGCDDIVAVCVERSVHQVVAILGILRAGAAYLPVDPVGPAERRRFMLEDGRPRAIVTNAAFRATLSPTCRNVLVVPDAFALERSGVAATGAPLPAIGTPQDLAYVLYTSGSTGTPKGVLNQHDGVSNHLGWMAERFPLTSDDRVLGKTPAVFDVSVWEWFWPLSQGACLVLTRAGGEKDPGYLLNAIESHGITNVHFVPTLLRVLLERLDLHRCRSVQRVFCSGEALTAELRDRFFDRMPGPPALINLYGPTEAAVHVTSWVCTPGETGSVPIGHPLPNVRTYIVDEDLRAVAEGVEGELLIGGIQVARGYLGRAELSRERFISDPFVDDPAARCYRTGDRVAWRADGAIEFFGRVDSQVQLGGARVELGEIEAALRLHPAVGDAAVLVREAGTSTRLYAYLRRAHRGEPDPSPDGLRRELANKLPDYMMPGRFVWLDEFPVTSTGKLDRRALSEIEAARPSIEPAFEMPRAGTETRLARLWCDELQIDRVGRHDAFHLLGGDSLGTVRLSLAIAAEFGIELTHGELLRSPTIALLAAVLDATHARLPLTTIVPLRARVGEQQPLYLPPSMGGQLFAWRDLVRALGPGRPVYGFSLPAEGEGRTDLRALAAVYVRDLLTFQPEGPYHLAGYSFSAALALEMAQQLRASGRSVGILAMIDYGPGAAESWTTTPLRTAGRFIQNLPYWLRYDLLHAGWASIAGRARRKIATLADRILSAGRGRSAETAQRVVDEMFDREQLPEPHRRLVIEHLDAFYRYRPLAYEGRILLFWARCRPLLHSLSPTLGWDRHAAGGFDRIVVACSHDDILMPPHVEVIAAGLDQALTDWERTTTAEVERELPQMSPRGPGAAGRARRTTV